MSIQAMAWVLKQEIGDPTAKLVLLCLANYAGEGGENAFPSVARLQGDTELSERTIRAKLDFLVEKHFLKLGDQGMAAAFAKRKDRITVCYDFIIRGASPAPRGSNGVQTASTGCSSQQNGVQTTTPRGARPAPNPSEILKRTSEREGGPPSKKAAPPKTQRNDDFSLAQILKEREQPPKGRQPTFDAEFKARFGCTPDEATQQRKDAESISFDADVPF